MVAGACGPLSAAEGGSDTSSAGCSTCVGTGTEWWWSSHTLVSGVEGLARWCDVAGTPPPWCVGWGGGAAPAAAGGPEKAPGGAGAAAGGALAPPLLPGWVGWCCDIMRTTRGGREERHRPGVRALAVGGAF